MNKKYDKMDEDDIELSESMVGPTIITNDDERILRLKDYHGQVSMELITMKTHLLDHENLVNIKTMDITENELKKIYSFVFDKQ